MKHLSESNKKILTQSIKSQKDKIPPHVVKIMQKSKCPQYHLGEKFKNMQDPLSYNKSKKVQQLRKDAFSASKSLHQEMDEISQVSKFSYKLIMTPQGNRYDFDQLLIRRFNNDSSLSDQQFYQKLKAKSEKFKKQQYDPQDYMQRIKHLNYPLKDLSNLLAKENQFFHQKQCHELNETSKSFSEKPLTFDVIKQMSAMGLGQNYKDYEFYQVLKDQPAQNIAPYVSQFNLSTNRKINRPVLNLKLNLIQDSLQFGSLSQELLYDFDGDLNFWREDPNKAWMDEKKKKTSDEDVMRQFMDMDMEKIEVNYMLKFGNKKITPWGIKEYKNLRKIHKKAQRQIENSGQVQTQTLVQQYYKLLEEYRYLRHSRKAQRQATPIKMVHSQAQTIYTMPNQHFDNYFKDDTIQILNQISKLNSLRQRVIKQQQYTNKIVMVQNICQDIKQLLFSLLLMMLKDQKFMSPEGFLMFGYGDLMQADNKREAESMILKFVLKNIDKFEVQQVDNVPKSDIIKIYAQQRDKNNKILQIIRSK